MIRDTVQEEALKLLIAQHAAREFMAKQEQAGGWALYVRIGIKWVAVRSRRQMLRTWPTPNGLLKYAQAIGCRQVLFEL